MNAVLHTVCSIQYTCTVYMYTNLPVCALYTTHIVNVCILYTCTRILNGHLQNFFCPALWKPILLQTASNGMQTQAAVHISRFKLCPGLQRSNHAPSFAAVSQSCGMTHCVRLSASQLVSCPAQSCHNAEWINVGLLYEEPSNWTVQCALNATCMCRPFLRISNQAT